MNKFLKRYNTAVLALFVFISIGFNSAYSQFGLQNDVVKIKSYLSFDKVYAGGEVKLAVEADIKDTWHINSDKPKDDFLVPTVLKISGDSNVVEVIKVAYPEAEDIKLDFSETPLSVWQGKTFFGALLEVPDNVQPGEYPLIVTLEYQACDNQSCLAPTSVTDTIVLVVADKQDVVNETNREIFDNIKLDLTPISGVSSNDPSDSITDILESQGILLGILFVFLGGLALNLTPCVYPLIPITIGYFGGQSEGSTKRLAAMGVLFVVGLAVTYSIIGVVTSLTGSMLGSLLQSPVIIAFVALILVGLSLSMFGVYEFKLPDKLVAKAGGAKGGYFGAFFMGLTMGIVAAPCIGPFVIGLVTYVAAKQDALFGFIMFFVLALGLGTPYLFLAIFSGKIKNLPRAGEWMQAVEHIFGLILIGMALYFLLPLLPDDISGYVLPVYMILAGIYILFFEKKARNIKTFQIVKTVFSVIIIGIAVYALIPSNKEEVDWKPYSDDAITTIEGRGVIIDFYADWCIPCKELDAITFSDPKVVAVSKEFETYKADMTESLSPEVSKLREKYNIVGVPTVLILNSKGEEEERITGFVGPEEFLEIIKNVD